MKQIFLLLFLCLSAKIAYAQNSENLIFQTSTIEEVTVYKTEARVSRVAKAVSLPKGKSKLVFRGNTLELVEQSLRVKTTEGVLITGIRAEKSNAENQAALSQRAEELHEKIKKLDAENVLYNNEDKLLQQEEKVLNANLSVKGTVSELRELLEYHKTVLQKNYARSEELKTLLAKNYAVLSGLNKEYRFITGDKDTPKNMDIEVELETKNATNADFLLTYIIEGASWTPFYDVRVKDIKSPLTIEYQAVVEQSSGEDWKNVRLILSNAEPAKSRNAPELKTWFLDTERILQKTRSTYDTVVTYDPETYEGLRVVENEYDAEAMYVKTLEKQTSIQFEIPVAYTILSGEPPVKLSLNVLTVPATYCYYTVPKMQSVAYLKAHITNWEQYNLMEGDAALYIDNAYIGESGISPFTTGDTISFGLGADPSVIIQRTKMRQFGKKQFLGNKRTDERTFSIKIRNTKKIPINIVVLDQIPVSQNKELTIENVEAKEGKIDAATGKITWKLDIPATTEKAVEFHYEAKYLQSERVFLE